MLRRSPRTLVLWAAAAAVALATAASVAGDLAELHRRVGDLGPVRAALVTTRDLPIGTKVAPGDLRPRRVHASQLPPGVLTDRADAAGRIVAVPLLRDEWVAARHLAPRRRSGLDGVLPPGTRAVRVPVADSLRPEPGAAVDVLATFPGADGDGALPGEATVVARGVTVLSTAGDAGDRTGDRGLAVTLLVDEATARDLALASTQGVLTLALVPPEDARP